MEKLNQILGAVVLVLSGGRIATRAARREAARRRAAWSAHVDELQNELNAERSRGWGFRYCDGRRVDW